MRTGDQINQTITFILEKTVLWWSGMKMDSGMMCPVITTYHSPAKKVQVKYDVTQYSPPLIWFYHYWTITIVDECLGENMFFCECWEVYKWKKN